MAQSDGFQKHPENINRNGRPKKGNSWKDVLSEAMEQEHEVGGQKKSLKQIIGDVLSKKAVKGDLKAIEMLMDRLEGKPKQQVENIGAERRDKIQIEFVEPGETSSET